MKLNLSMPIHKSLALWSQRLNVAASVVIAYVLASPDVLLSTLNQLPDWLRPVVPPAVGIGLFVLVSVVRLAKQKVPNDAAPKQ